MGIAPNPADNHVTITFPGSAPVDLDIIEATGRLVARRSHVSSPLRLELDAFTPGLYYVRMRSPGGGTHTGVLVVN